MTLKETLTILGTVLSIVMAGSIIPFIIFIVFPFFQSFSPEKKLEKYVDEQCIHGNEIAIAIRRENSKFYSDRDYKLIRAAIDGNEHAIKALKLDPESQKKKYF